MRPLDPVTSKQRLAYGLAFFVVFVATLALWRWVLRVEVRAGTLRGRNPEEVRHTVLELSEIRSVYAGEFVIGRIKGWVFEATRGRAVFVPEPALEDPDLRRIFEHHRQQVGTTT